MNFYEYFFQHENKGKHQQLRKFLFDLQNAQWIKKYWQEFHKNIIDNLVEQMTEHVQEMKQSFRNISLDLDNVDKINDIARIITDIHQMKDFPSLIPAIAELDLRFSRRDQTWI